MAKAARSLSPKQILERTRLHRQAVKVLARLAAKRAVQDDLRAQGVRVSLVPPRNIAEKASAYLAAHPELYQLALQRAHTLGYIDPRGAKAQINHFDCADVRCEMTTIGYARVREVIAQPSTHLLMQQRDWRCKSRCQ